MSKASDVDLAAAHKYFSAYCFNAAWDLMENNDRTARDDQLMVALSFASIFHWSNRSDCADKNLSIGYWQASRVQALIDNPREAARLGAYSGKLPPFFLAYAHEALARAHMMAGDHVEAERHLRAARDLLHLIEGDLKGDRARLEADLEQIARL